MSSNGRYAKIYFTSSQNPSYKNVGEIGLADSCGNIIFGHDGSSLVGSVRSVAQITNHERLYDGLSNNVGAVLNSLDSNSHIVVDFGSIKTVGYFRVANGSVSGRAVKRWVIQLSDDNISYTTLYESSEDETVGSSNGGTWIKDGSAVASNLVDADLSTYYVIGSTTCSADPYISTRTGQIYKMDNFTGFFRLVQGNLNGKQITINGYLQLDNKDEEKECNNVISEFLLDRNINVCEKYNISNNSATVYQTTDLSNQSFIHLFYIKYGVE